MSDFVVYLTVYSGDLHPPYYIGSTSKKRLDKGYSGSVASKKWKSLVLQNKKENPSQYCTFILSEHNKRYDALLEEERVQRLHDVVKSCDFYNESFACANGYFGRDVSGINNPMFGKQTSDKTRKAASAANKGYMVVSKNNGTTWERVTVEDYYLNQEIYNTPKGEFPNSIAEATRQRVADGTHHFCDPEVQKRIADKRRGVYKMSDKNKNAMSKRQKERQAVWGNKNLKDNKHIWHVAYEIEEFIEKSSGVNVKGNLKHGMGKAIQDYLLSINVDPRSEVKGWAKVVRKIMSGWQPKNDKEYLIWRESL